MPPQKHPIIEQYKSFLFFNEKPNNAGSEIPATNEVIVHVNASDYTSLSVVFAASTKVTTP